MSTAQPHTAAGTAGTGHPKVNYLNHEKGLWSWLSSLDHKRIGLMYMVGVLSAFLLGGVSALMVRTEHLTPGQTIVGADAYNRWFTLHGASMVFLFIIPGIPAILGNFALPIMLGTKDVVFPRLNLASFYLWLTGALFLVVSILLGGIDTGWTFYTPYSSTYASPGSAVLMALMGAFILGFSSILTGLNFMATIHMLRAKGMGWFQIPLFAWSLYATGIMQILATPVLAITLLLLICERTLGVGIFDPALGGDPVLFQHFFWFYSHPAVYIMILPAMGVISEVISTYSHKEIFGYKFIAFSSVAIALLSFFVWGHHMFVSGQSELMGIIFSLITFTIAIPTAIKVFNWLATMYKGAIDLKTPMLYGMSFIWVFTRGGLTGLQCATLATDVLLHDTYFIVAHFHDGMVGGTVFGFLAGLHHWWPKMFGKMYSERWALISWVFVFFGFNMTFFPQFLMGSQGMPRRYWWYEPEFYGYHFASTIGSYLQAVGFFMTLFVLLHSLFRGKKAPANPWGAPTLEWQTASPPPPLNFEEGQELIVGNPYEFRDMEYDPSTEGYVKDPNAKLEPAH
ncbi:MAG: cbb3-type cytochrome c oxidase subunit I [Phycisphaeraceae bacterium]|nr:cbb3-type cytochrome c oxidase subunit I [Phycisphaeraceae bacterium]